MKNLKCGEINLDIGMKAFYLPAAKQGIISEHIICLKKLNMVEGTYQPSKKNQWLFSSHEIKNNTNNRKNDYAHIKDVSALLYCLDLEYVKKMAKNYHFNQIKEIDEFQMD